jgi:Ran GTPase-activating protein (RanGAP) involved in mRNA processing and transport
MANLTHLNLSNTHKSPAVLIAIAKSPAMSKLQHLKLYNSRTGNKGVVALAQSTTLKNLTLLDLGQNGIGPVGVKALCTSDVASSLKSLWLECNADIRNSSAAALASPSSTLYSLIDLHLSETNLDYEGMAQLLKTPHLDQLDVLGVDGEALRATRSGSAKFAYLTRFRPVRPM